mgnify:FL=1
MADNKFYLAVGEEAARGTAESTAVGFVPLKNGAMPKIEYEDKLREEFRGEDSHLGDTTQRRMSEKWSASLGIPFYTKTYTPETSIITKLLKHFFGKAVTAQNGATGQYYHMLYPVIDPFATANLGAKGLTLNYNINEGATQKNWPFVGGRVKSLAFDQEPGQQLIMGVELFGQKRNASATAIASPVYAAENLRCDYNNLKVYTGTITRTGTGPDYTDFTFATATQIKPDKISVKIENGFEDVLRLGGVNYPDKTRLAGKVKVSLELTIDWEDPASGFSSVDEVAAWVAAASTTNFFLHYDTGTQAGTGNNHQLYIDLPLMRRMGGEPDYSLEKDPMVTLKYEGLYDSATTKYIAGLMVKNDVSAA